MAVYLLDTDTCSYIMRRSHPKLLKKLQLVPLGDVAISVVTLAELLYGAKVSTKPKLAMDAFGAFIKHLSTLDWTPDAAEHYADIRANLRKRGEMISANDLLIAAHARSASMVLVTNHVAEFKRVEGLKVVNWSV